MKCKCGKELIIDINDYSNVYCPDCKLVTLQTKKTDEELAEEFLEKDGAYCKSFIRVSNNEIQTVKKYAFLAGRKSATVFKAGEENE